MNKRLSIIILILTSGICNAQFEKGTHLINLGISGEYNSHSETDYGDTALYSYSNNRSYNSHSTYIGISPSFGFFIKENIMLSIGPSYTNQSFKYNYDYVGTSYDKTTSTTNYYGGQISLQRFYNLSGRLYWDYYLGAGYRYGISKNNLIDYTQYSRTWNTYSDNVFVSAGAGFAYLVNDYWLINGSIGNLGWGTNWNKKTKSNSSEVGSRYTESRLYFSAFYISLGISLVIKNGH